MSADSSQGEIRDFRGAYSGLTMYAFSRMCRDEDAMYFGAVQTGRRAALQALHEGVRNCLLQIEPKRLAYRRSPNAPTVGEMIGLLLMDLDLLSSRSQDARGILPEFATDFMNKRLARRLTERYKDRDLAAEFDRRFAVAQNLVSEDRIELEPTLARIGSRLGELEAALRSTGAAP